jgi:hypothetical protein
VPGNKVCTAVQHYSVVALLASYVLVQTAASLFVIFDVRALYSPR